MQSVAYWQDHVAVRQKPVAHYQIPAEAEKTSGDNGKAE